MRIFDRDAAVLPIPEQADIVHRARPIERDERNDIPEVRRPHSRQSPAHAFGFQLEHANRVTTLEERIDVLIVPCEGIEIGPHTFARLDQVARLLKDRERLEAEEVELHQPCALAVFHVELRDRHVGPRVAIERDELCQWPVTDHNAGCVGRTVTGQPFQLQRKIEQPPDLRIGLVLGSEFRNAIECAFKRPGVRRVIGNELGQPVDMAVAHLEHTAGVLQHSTRLQPPEGDDLGHLVATIFRLNIADHFLAPGFAEVDVEVRHRDAFGIEEAFEQQPQLDRVKIRDRQRPGNDRPRARSTTRTHGDAVFLRPFDEIGNDQEIGRKTHGRDDVQFELQPIPIDLMLAFGNPRQPPFEPGCRIAAQLRGLALCIPDNAGQDRATLGGHDGASLGNDQCIGQGLRQVGKKQTHVARGFDPGIGRALDPVVAVHIARVRDAEHDVMRIVEIGFGKIGRVGRDQRQVKLMRDLDQARFACAFDRVERPGDLDIDPARKQLQQAIGIANGCIVLSFGNEARHRPFGTPCERDQPIGVFGQLFKRDMGRLFKRAIKMRGRGQRAEIGIACLILRIERQPVIGWRDSIGPVRSRDCEQGSDDRLNARRLAGLGEFHDAIEAIAVRDRGGRKTKFPRPLCDALRIDGAFEHRIGGQDSQGNKGRMRHEAVLGGGTAFVNSTEQQNWG